MKTLCTLIFSSTCSLCRVESGLGLMGLGNMDIKIQSVCNIVVNRSKPNGSAGQSSHSSSNPGLTDLPMKIYDLIFLI